MHAGLNLLVFVKSYHILVNKRKKKNFSTSSSKKKKRDLDKYIFFNIKLKRFLPGITVHLGIDFHPISL